MINIVIKFFEASKIDIEKEKQDEYNEILGSKQKKKESPTQWNILLLFLKSIGKHFDSIDNMFNMLIKKVLPNKDAQRFFDAIQ